MLWTVFVLGVGIYIGVRFDDNLTAFAQNLKTKVIG
jgi:hypothetical protein